MRSLVAARRVNASLVRIAASIPAENPLRRVFLAWAKMASLEEDQFARLSYIEGALGYTPNTLVKKPGLHLKAAKAALESGDYDSNPITRKFIYELGMEPMELMHLLELRDTGLWRNLNNVASKLMQPSGTIRGLSAESIVNSILFGISPITGEWMKYGQGKGMMYYLGTKAPDKVKFGGIRSIAMMELANRVKDVIKGTSSAERGMVQLDAPVGEGDESYTLQDLLVSDDTRTFNEDLASAVLRYDKTLDIISPVVLESLRTPAQKMVWEIVRDNPSILTLGGGKIGVQGRELAKLFAERSGQEYTGKTMDVVVSKVFKEYVLPKMFSALKDDEAAKELIRSRDILQVMKEEIHRRNKNEGGGFADVAPSPNSPVRQLSPESAEWKKEQRRINRLENTFRFASTKGALVRLAATLQKGSADRKSLLKLAQSLQEDPSASDPQSKDQNLPETYYGLPPKGVQASKKVLS